MGEDSEVGANDSLHHYAIDMGSSISFFTMLVVFVLYVFSQTTTYNKHVLNHVSKDTITELNQQSDKGIMVTAIILAILVALLDALRRNKMI